MSWMPGVARRELPESAVQPRIRPRQVIVHTAVDHGLDIPEYFGRPEIRVESHFWVMTDGLIAQMVDSEVRADANYRANGSAISIETEDGGRPSTPWTAEQVRSIRSIIVWCSVEHRIPIEVCLTPTSAGLGWHSMWSYPDDPIGLTGRPVSSPWTTSFGKTCPGSARIRQLLYNVAPGASTGDPLQVGSTGLLVEDIQRKLGVSPDGQFGPVTEAAVNGWLASLDKIPQGGLPWRLRADLLLDRGERVPARMSGYLPLTLAAGRDDGSARYRGLVGRLNSAFGVPGQEWSPLTEAAVRAFQAGCGLTVDGIVGRWTWGTLFVRPTVTLDVPHNPTVELGSL